MTVVSSARLLKILLWKNFLHYKRKVFWTLFSFVCPVLLVAVLLIFRRQISPEDFPNPTTFAAFSVDALPRGSFDLKALVNGTNASSYYDVSFTEYRRKYEGDLKRRNFSIGGFGWSDIPWAEIERWELERAEGLGGLLNASATFYSVAYSPDNEMTRAVMARVKDAAKIRQLMPFESEAAMVESLREKRAFAIDGGVFASALPGFVGGLTTGLDSTTILCGISFDATDFADFEKKKDVDDERATTRGDDGGDDGGGDDDGGGSIGGNMKNEMEEERRKKIQYSIRFPHSPNGATRRSAFQRAKQWNTDKVFPRQRSNGPRDPEGRGSDDPGYYEQGFLALQWILNKELIRFHVADEDEAAGEIDDRQFVDDVIFGLKQFGYPPYWDDPFGRGIQSQLPFLLIISFLIVCLNVVRNVAKEKELSLKETMKVMGLSNGLYWTSWFLTSSTYALAVVVVVTILFKVSVPEGGKIINFTDGSVIFVFLAIYALSLISFCFLVSTIFKKANTAAIGGGVIFFLTFIPYFIVYNNYDAMSLSAKMGCGLFLNTGLAMGCLVVGNFEGKGTGLGWSDISRPVDVDDNLAMGHVWGILFLDMALCWLLAWYVEKVRPGDFGTVHPWYFPFSKSYWSKGGRESSVEERDEIDSISNPYFETSTNQSEPGIKIRNLEKTYKNGCKLGYSAVKGVSLDMFRNEIFVLLGENGAGKSTTIGCLMGLTDPTTGTAWINGFNVKTAIDEARKSMGVCPQHDVLFDLLTVREHLIFYGRLKNQKMEELDEAVEEILSDLELKDKQNFLASKLSGGQKRKLSLAVAMIGKPSVLLLDEPTSGMDPKNRRITWKMLQKYKKGTTILLTTHFMDEAETLADSIGIMNRGKIACCGSPLYLKNKVGNNYHLIVSKSEVASDEKIGSVVKNHIPEAFLERSTLVESSYGLPREKYREFSKIFNDIDENRDSIGVEGYACAAPNVEEIFLKVCQERRDDKNDSPSEEIVNLGFTHDEVGTPTTEARASSNEQDAKNRGISLYKQQFFAMLTKKVLHTWRNKIVTLGQLLIPNIFTLLILLVIKISPPLEDSPSLKLSLEHMGKTLTPIAYNGSIQNEFATRFRDEAKWKTNQIKVVPSVYSKNLTLGPIDDYVIDAVASQSRKAREKIHIGADFTTLKAECQRYVDPDVSVVDDNICEVYELETSVPSTPSLITGATPVFIGYFNDRSYHSAPITLQTLSNSLAAKFGIELVASNHPLPRSFSEVLDDKITTNARFSGSFNFGFLFGMSFLAATFSILLIKERVSKAKHVQIVSGLHTLTFWFATFVWDFINFLAPCLITLVLFYVFEIEAFLEDRTLVALIVLIFYIIAQLPLVYLFSLWFQEATSGFVYSTIIGIFTGIALIMTILILTSLDLNDAASIVEQISLLISPPYNVGQGMQNIYLNYWNAEICNLEFNSTKDLVKSFIPSGIVENTPFSLFGPTNEDEILNWLLETYPDYEIPGYNVTIGGFFDKPPTDALCFFMENANISFPCCPDSGCAGSVVGCAKHVSYFSMDTPGVGKNLIFFAIQAVVCFLLIMLYEYKILRSISNIATSNYLKLKQFSFFRKEMDDELRLASSMETDRDIQLEIEDDNIEKENKRIQQLDSCPMESDSFPTLVVNGLKKVYSKFSGSVAAVDGISMCVDKGELFGLLGVNGAGKTTTFKMLTGDEVPSDGSIVVEGTMNIQKDLKAIQQRMGYCPQSDALIDQLTGRETLRMYSRLRGIKEDRIERMIESIAKDLVLMEHIDKLVGQYSGGNKRKLSTAIAVLGDPKMVLLDEPTTGMDPSARRQLWDSLIKIRNRSRQSIILTSHSMEECEALCTRISIMMNGQIQCLGSPQYLKDKYAECFYLQAVIRGENVETRSQVLKRRVGGTILEEEGNGKVVIKIPKAEKRWAQVFNLVESSAQELGLEDYVLSQTTLEQVFLSISESAAN